MNKKTQQMSKVINSYNVLNLLQTYCSIIDYVLLCMPHWGFMLSETMNQFPGVDENMSDTGLINRLKEYICVDVFQLSVSVGMNYEICQCFI